MKCCQVKRKVRAIGHKESGPPASSKSWGLGVGMREKHRGRWKIGRRAMEGREAGVVFPTGVLDSTILRVPRPQTHPQSWASVGHSGCV